MRQKALLFRKFCLFLSVFILSAFWHYDNAVWGKKFFHFAHTLLRPGGDWFKTASRLSENGLV